jgi:hypothetical protein
LSMQCNTTFKVGISDIGYVRLGMPLTDRDRDLVEKLTSSTTGTPDLTQFNPRLVYSLLVSTVDVGDSAPLNEPGHTIRYGKLALRSGWSIPRGCFAHQSYHVELPPHLYYLRDQRHVDSRRSFERCCGQTSAERCGQSPGIV